MVVERLEKFYLHLTHLEGEGKNMRALKDKTSKAIKDQLKTEITRPLKGIIYKHDGKV